jgi:hypothetical protein
LVFDAKGILDIPRLPLLTFHELFVPFRISRVWQHYHCTPPLTVRNILSEFFFFSPPNFIRNFRLCCSIFILVTNPAEHHNTVALKQSLD